jgi:hypothetical protein
MEVTMPELEILEELEYELDEDDDDEMEYDALEEIEELLESIEEDGAYDLEEDAERRRRRRRGRRGRARIAPRRPMPRRVPTAGGKGLYQRPPSKNLVTQAQLKQALDKVGVEIRKNAAGIKAINTQVAQVNGRITEVNSRLGGRIDTVSAVNDRQNKAIAGVKRQQESMQQGLLFQALLGGGKRKATLENAITVTEGTTTRTVIPANTEITLKESGDKFEKLLPVLAASGGFGGSSNGSQGGGGLFSNPLMLLLLLDDK